jgi:hypothetical protein
MSATVQGAKVERGDANRRFAVLAVSNMWMDLWMRGNVCPRSQVEQIVEDYFLKMVVSANTLISQMAKLCGPGQTKRRRGEGQPWEIRSRKTS